MDAQQRLLPWAQPFSGLKPGPSWATALCTCHRAQHPGVQACEALRPSRAPEQQSTALRSVIATELGLGLPWAGRRKLSRSLRKLGPPLLQAGWHWPAPAWTLSGLSERLPITWTALGPSFYHSQ